MDDAKRSTSNMATGDNTRGAPRGLPSPALASLPVIDKRWRDQWVEFVEAPSNPFVTVLAYELVRGDAYAAGNGRLIGIDHMTRDEFIDRLYA